MSWTDYFLHLTAGTFDEELMNDEILNERPTYFLVACAKSKANEIMPAKDLYQSLWFSAARAYAESKKTNNSLWFILSAKHGLLSPNTPINPYELTLNTMKKQDRIAWAKLVARQISTTLVPGKVVILAGKYYREFLVPILQERGFVIDEPLARLGIGEQVQWLQKKVLEEKKV